MYGYLVFRDRFAAELEEEVPVLDERVAKVVERMMRGLQLDEEPE